MRTNRSSALCLLTTLAAALALNGCALFSQPLRDENTLLKARVMQLEQDLSAERAQSRQAGETNQELRMDLVAYDRQIRELNDEIKTLKQRLESNQRLMTDQQRDQAADIARQMEERQETEASLRARIEDLEAEAEATAARASLLASELEAARERVAALDNESETARALVTTLQADLEKVSTERDAASAERDDFRRQLSSVESNKDELATELESLSASLRENQKELEAAKRQAETLSAQLEQRRAETAASAGLAETLRGQFRTELAPFVQAGDVKVFDGDEAGVIVLSDALYNPGTVLLSDRGIEILEAIERAIDGVEYGMLKIEGHTDSVPVRNMPFVDNWDLAASRAATVARWLASRPGVPARKIVAESRSFYDPIGSNETAAGRRQNRRVEITVTP